MFCIKEFISFFLNNNLLPLNSSNLDRNISKSFIFSVSIYSDNSFDILVLRISPKIVLVPYSILFSDIFGNDFNSL